MSANTSQIYPALPLAAQCTVSVANPNLDGTGTLATLVSGGTNGARVDRINIKAHGTTHTGTLRFFVDDGTTKQLLAELAVPYTNAPAVGGSAYAAEWKRTDGEPLVLLGPSQVLKVSTQIADTFSLVASGGAY